jgi:uncharacterized protein (DUF2235 family)
MSKNIVICIDGTGNEFGNTNSNVIKLYSTLIVDPDRQVVYYHPGLGTMGAPGALTKLAKWWTKLLGQAFGYGLSGALQDGYSFLMENYVDGDLVYIFGFSRGAYCARALAAMLHMYGLLHRGNEPLIPYVLRMFEEKKKTEEDFALASTFKNTFSKTCKSHFVGVWDTVSSVGWIHDPFHLPYTAMNPDVQNGCHAISIDERRCAFRQNLWSAKTRQDQDLKQVWFAGVHSDIGGGYPEQESGLAKISLKWMLDESRAKGLLVSQELEQRVLGVTDPSMSRPSCTGQLHKSLKGIWWGLEIFPRRFWDAKAVPQRIRWKIPLASPRPMAATSEVHPSVCDRILQDSTYRPPNLPPGKCPPTSASAV